MPRGAHNAIPAFGWSYVGEGRGVCAGLAWSRKRRKSRAKVRDRGGGWGGCEERSLSGTYATSSCELPGPHFLVLVRLTPPRATAHTQTNPTLPLLTLLGEERTSLDGRRKRRWIGRGGDDEEDEPALVVGDDPAAAAAAAGMVNGRERKSGVQEDKERETKEWLLHMFLPRVLATTLSFFLLC